jgi:hypothetical protein
MLKPEKPCEINLVGEFMGFRSFQPQHSKFFTILNYKKLAVLFLLNLPNLNLVLVFRRGSEQALHEDMAVFHILPLNHLVLHFVAAGANRDGEVHGPFNW